MSIIDILFFKQVRAEKRQQRIIELLGQRTQALSLLHRKAQDREAQAQKAQAEAELKKLGVF